MTERELDIVLFGATGFVGRLVAAHLAEAADPGVRIGLAGRSSDRLRQVRDGLGGRAGDWELIEVDATDAAGLAELASRTQVVASTVGPYLRHGKELVRACAEHGTHYADLTGETLFVRWSLDEVDARARETGARIVHSCGFDSVPSDLGVLFTAEQAAANGDGTLTDTTLVVRELRGGLSGGTIDSARQQIIAARKDHRARTVLSDPYGLSPRRSEEPPTAHGAWGRTGLARRLGKIVTARRDPESNHWFGPFIMGAYNASVVRLSNTLSGWSYGRDFRYREVRDTGRGVGAVAAAAGTGLAVGAVMGGLSFAPTRRVLDAVLPNPGDGPSERSRAQGAFRYEIRADTTGGVRYTTTVADDRDPGYDGTAVMLGQSALALAMDADRLPGRDGVLTPATGLGDALIDRLRRNGFVFTLARG